MAGANFLLKILLKTYLIHQDLKRNTEYFNAAGAMPDSSLENCTNRKHI